MQSGESHGTESEDDPLADAAAVRYAAGAASTDLSTPHERFPFCTKSGLYDKVTGMYLDCWDDAEIARTLSEEFGCEVSQETISGIRTEAAIEAEKQQSPEIRKKWIFRYKHLTVNNLVKEYMFLEGKTDFLRAKRELADEIDLLVRTSPPDRLWIAVNDALGRNNIGQDIVQKILAYGRSARKVEAAISAFEKSRGVTFVGGTREVAEMIAAVHSRAGVRGIRGTAVFMATLLGHDENTFCDDDVEYCLEWSKSARNAAAVDAHPVSRIMQGADIFMKTPVLLDRVLNGIAYDLSAGEVMQLAETIRQGPLLSRGQIETIKTYAVRHISDNEMKEKLAVPGASPGKRKDEMKAIQILMRVLDDHLSLTDAQTFFTEKEIDRAGRRGIIQPHLQALLDRLNLLRTLDAVVGQINDQQLHTKFEFPAERYCKRRFGEYCRQGFGVPASFWSK